MASSDSTHTRRISGAHAPDLHNPSDRQVRRYRTAIAIGRIKSFFGGQYRPALAAIMCTATIATAIPQVAVAAPVNPSDQEISDAEAQVQSGSNDVASLAGQVSSSQERLAELERTMGGLREAVNKALVDLHDAQSTAEQARQGVVLAKRELNETQERIEKAQAKLDEISRSAYRRGAAAPVSGIAGNATSDEALDRQTYLRTSAEKQREAIEEIDRLRTENANRESTLREARNVAETRESEAEDAEAQARQAIEDNSAELEKRNAEHKKLLGEQRAAQARLDASRGHVSQLNQQRKEYQDYQKAEKARKEAEREAAKKARVAREAAEAERKEREEEARRAAEEAEQARQAEEEARQAKEAAEAEEARRLAEQVAATQPTHTDLDNPYPTDEDAETTSIAALGNPNSTASQSTSDTDSTETDQSDETEETEEPDGTDESDDSGVSESTSGTTSTSETADSSGTSQASTGVSTSQDVSVEVSASASGSASEQIETVIARAKSQLGVSYAWGGGDANGPTQGIRDGGVADSYGDYNKIGFDCSGLVVYAFAGVGISLPHYSGYQYQYGTKISPSEIKRGDLLFWGPNAEQHVAIYLGDGMMIEAPQSGSVVQISSVRYSGMSPYAVRLIG